MSSENESTPNANSPKRGILLGAGHDQASASPQLLRERIKIRNQHRCPGNRVAVFFTSQYVIVMAFDWQRTLDQHRIAYSASGANVSRGNIVVRCPFCGSADEGQHMSINLQGKGWRCFRNHDHSGKNPVRLLQALLGCTPEHAASLVGKDVYIPDDFEHQVMQYMTAKQANKPHDLKLLEVFKPLNTVLPSAGPFIRYLRERGYTVKQCSLMTQWYDLRYCIRGAFAYRIIFPIYHMGKLVSWTGRSITKTAIVRYKTLRVSQDMAEDDQTVPAIGPISNYLLWYDDLIKSDHETIVLCEGPFDALKIDVLGYHHGIRATCFFTSGPSAHQIELLHTLLPRYKRRLLCLDQNTLPNMIKIQAKLSGLGVEILQLPKQFKDPGELDRNTLLKVCA